MELMVKKSQIWPNGQLLLNLDIITKNLVLQTTRVNLSSLDHVVLVPQITNTLNFSKFLIFVIRASMPRTSFETNKRLGLKVIFIGAPSNFNFD